MFLGPTYPCPSHVGSAIEKLSSRIAQVDLILLDNGGIRFAGLVMDNRSIWARRGDSVER